MAVGVELVFQGATLDQYDQVISKMGFTPNGPGASDGGMFHWAAATADGIRVTDVWETIEQFQQFAEEQIRPITLAVGFSSEPEITVTAVHNHFTAGATASAEGAVAVELAFQGATLDQYDRACGEMGFEPGGRGPDGARFHWSAATADGFRVVDVWETIEQFQQFAEEHIRPVAQSVGLENEPEVTVTAVHNYLTAG